MWYVYIIRCRDNSLYTGITTDLKRREREHNTSKKGAKSTRSKRPVEIVYVELYNTQSDALKRESAIKHLPKVKKELLIQEKKKEEYLV